LRRGKRGTSGKKKVKGAFEISGKEVFLPIGGKRERKGKAGGGDTTRGDQ